MPPEASTEYCEHMSPSPLDGPPAPETPPRSRARVRRWRRLRARLRLFRRRMHTHPVLHLPWRILVGTVGTVVFLAGVVMLVVPGPGIASMLLGLLILGTEFRWARRMLHPAKVWAIRGERWALRLKDDYLRRFRRRRAARRGRNLGDPTD